MIITKCVECGKEYQLEQGENVSDFQCECGGDLKYTELFDVGNTVDLESSGICPLCKELTPLNGNYCQECGEKTNFIEVIDDYSGSTKSEGMFIACNECGYLYEFSEDEKLNNFQFCDCGGKFKFYMNRDEYFNSKEYLETFLNSNKSSTKKFVTKTVNKLINGETIEDKKSKYGFLIGAKGIEGRLELYDNWIRLPDKEYLLIEDISSIDFQGAQGLRGRGFIKFNLKGMDRANKQKGPLVTYNPHTGLGMGAMGVKGGKASMITYNPRSGFGLGLGVLKGSEPPKIHFSKEWESQFREIRDVLYTKILERKGLEKIEFKNKDLTELEMLTELRDRGIINEKEFEAKKKQILGL